VDVVLRARHDQLAQEFRCAATELRLLHAPPGSRWPRAIEPFCSDERAARFGAQLSDFATCCARCEFFSPTDAAAADGGLRDSALAEAREPV
jgi:hypothetical protein